MGLVVACLCAEWCGSCRDYRKNFASLSAAFPECRFVWLDIEEEPELVGDIDIKDFPTILIAEQGRVLFAGTVLPYIEHLKRMLDAFRGHSAGRAGRAPQAQTENYTQLASRLCGG